MTENKTQQRTSFSHHILNTIQQVLNRSDSKYLKIQTEYKGTESTLLKKHKKTNRPQTQSNRKQKIDIKLKQKSHETLELIHIKIHEN